MPVRQSEVLIIDKDFCIGCHDSWSHDVFSITILVPSNTQLEFNVCAYVHTSAQIYIFTPTGVHASTTTECRSSLNKVEDCSKTEWIKFYSIICKQLSVGRADNCL